ncbi:MAG: MMPL family transporter [Bacteroidales bacterium]|nr:MMPL family transporter [Bacteroidales bacterium]MCF8334494.1 MMPL family transporter [Bacteroidales bacterium]
MWKYVVRFILRSRIAILSGIIIITGFLAYQAQDIKLSYELTKMLPEEDSTSIVYEKFKKTFGKDGNIMFAGLQSERLFELGFFNDLYDLTYDLKETEGVKQVLSLPRIYHLEKNKATHKFDFKPIITEKPKSQKELDSLKQVIYDQPLFENMLFNKKKHSTLLMISLDKEVLNNKKRVKLIGKIKNKIKPFGEKHNVTLHYSGLPYIRTLTSQKIQSELNYFILLAMFIASVALFLFFRSFKAVLIPMLIVVISVVWVLGTMALLDYKITILTGILPPLLIVIGVENCIFLLNKYHHEYRAHGNKIKSLSRVVRRVGNATFLTNLTTAVGFAAFIITGNKLLVEFGVVASINIMAVFLLSLLLIPIFFSFVKPPNAKHIKHLDNKVINKIIDNILWLVLKRRNAIYIVAGFVVIMGVIGVMQMQTNSKMFDDLSSNDKVYKDMVFMQEQVNGILPFEIAIDTKKPNGVMRLSTLKKIERLQDTLATYPQFSKPLSVAEVSKAAKQAFYNGDPAYYSLPNAREKNFIMSYLPDLQSSSHKQTILSAFTDSNLQKTRVSVQMADIGTDQMVKIKDDLRPKIDAIFPPDKFNVDLTGTTVVYMRGTEYMITNLLHSLLIALAAIGIIMALLFTSGKMVAVSLVPNLLPQLMTAALMGYLAISLKPSTVLIFSIALGISVDNAIHFLSRYRMELKQHGWSIKISVINALRETSYSMVYSSIVLFFGFAIFTLSGFGGTEAIGYLVSFTLLVAVLSNLLVLPSLILSLDKWITTRSFNNPMLKIFKNAEEATNGKKNTNAVSLQIKQKQATKKQQKMTAKP